MKNKEQFDILVYTAMHERHAVSRLWCISMKRFINSFSVYTFKVVAVVSNQESVDICNEYGFDSVLTKNNPLGRKFNYGLECALLYYDFQYVLIMGDDDILLDGARKHYHEVIKNNIPYAGFGAIYFWAPKTRQVIFYSYERAGSSPNKLIGCGRIISRKALEAAGWRQDIRITKPITKYPILGKFSPGFTYQLSHQVATYLHEMKFGRISTEKYFSLWNNEQEKGLDHESEMKLVLSGYMPIRLAGDGDIETVMIDIKTDKNIWPINKYLETGYDVNELDIIWKLSSKEVDYIANNLR